MSTEKNEKTTPKRLKEAKEKGQVVKSVEITSGVQLVALVIYFLLTGYSLVEQAKALIRSSIIQLQQPLTLALARIGAECMTVLMHIVVVLGGALIVVTIIAGIAQVGPLLATKAVSFKGERINPIQNAKQLFSLRSVFELMKSLLKVGVLTLIFGYLLMQYAPSFGYLTHCGSRCALPVFSTLMGWLLGSLIACYLVFSLMDYAFQRYTIMKQLKMSHDEVKREHKDSNGDPHIKQKRRQLQHEVQSGSFATNVRRSTAVVRNPTHFAVCLIYHPEETPLPIVIEKGHDEQAALIVSLAEQSGIPVVENIALARALHRDVACGDTIPEQFFEPVAALLRMALELDYQPSSDDPPR
ncbi:EscU/YscU/HrcU family type III secretion system export apparatus switch protein [Yersinia pseudotuberculosis]|uniref:EscU/YscU/HrcU family type III secretion system export apparatus switch protein n=1 Tax=Yersinia pseudotuberculosis TaxID=633 RepID=UPI000348CF8E|nr:EscU/YscU/HrcU family type III secretion system export apparatus switch protein [Yersinia pseudotuberculosis]QET00564.1 EscU/YscU/HrcU family type III secretion system export apparatus switch protein [Yersinia pseudotuberculosis]CFU83174.1 secretion system apparatus protein SsaU [Yersinia pseudotuberculosis]CNB04772.1 secretion system apparatus protein SsaU [Yersinia pseudotuberculosis]CNB54504.1 secretion system apparatus protein SsaU [Yersinia pseudotuberculosis]CRY57646.1 secretion syste